MPSVFSVLNIFFREQKSFTQRARRTQEKQKKPKSQQALSPATRYLQPFSSLFPDQAQLAVLSIEREPPQLGRLRRKLWEHRAARPWAAGTRRLKRRRVGKYRDA
jgi:hypothetical protein